jgi:CubicO group peptidase (beta-lactamase class C family)
MELAHVPAAAIEYARKHALRALLVAQRNDLLVGEYDDGFTPATAHPLYSGTKSFWGVAALYACADGLLSLDEPVAETIAPWRSGCCSR